VKQQTDLFYKHFKFYKGVINQNFYHVYPEVYTIQCEEERNTLVAM